MLYETVRGKAQNQHNGPASCPLKVNCEDVTQCQITRAKKAETLKYDNKKERK